MWKAISYSLLALPVAHCGSEIVCGLSEAVSEMGTKTWLFVSPTTFVFGVPLWSCGWLTLSCWIACVRGVFGGWLDIDLYLVVPEPSHVLRHEYFGVLGILGEGGMEVRL